MMEWFPIVFGVALFTPFVLFLVVVKWPNLLNIKSKPLPRHTITAVTARHDGWVVDLSQDEGGLQHRIFVPTVHYFNGGLLPEPEVGAKAVEVPLSIPTTMRLWQYQSGDGWYGVPFIPTAHRNLRQAN